MPKIIREIEEHELNSVLAWAKKEGWDIGQYDGATYFKLSSRDFLVLVIDHEVAGVILAAKFNASFVFIGLFIINEPYRGQGYGKQLWNAAVEKLGFYSSVNLYAVPQQLSLYRHLGLVDRHINKRYYFRRNTDNIFNDYKDFEMLTNAAYLTKYDRQICGFSREEFLGLLLQQTEASSSVAFEKNRKEIDSVQNREISVRQGYLIQPVLGDGGCCYTPLGITREQAFHSLSEHVLDIREMLKKPVKEALFDAEFYHYLCVKNIFDSSIPRESLICDDKILNACAFQEDVQRAYLLYNIIEKNVDAGRAHPAILQALMNIQNIELHIWQVGDKEELVSLHSGEENYGAYIPKCPIRRIDLVYVDNNHFNLVKFQGYADSIPERGMYPLESLRHREIIGYGILRRCLRSYRVGPLYSDTFEGAQAITQKLLSQIPIGETAMFDIPSKNRWINQYVTFFRLIPENSGDTYLLSKGEEQGLAEENCFGVASLEIG
jgi:GNAT superfamily N-acetyltransferase